MNTCNTCNHWKCWQDHGNDMGDCLRTLSRKYPGLEADGIFLDKTGWGTISTGPLFGCIHHEAKRMTFQGIEIPYVADLAAPWEVRLEDVPLESSA